MMYHLVYCSQNVFTFTDNSKLLKMLHRSYSLLSFIRQSVSGCRTERFYIFQVGLAKRHKSNFIRQKLIHVISSTSKFSNNKNVDTRWIYSSSRFVSNDSKAKTEKEEKTLENKTEQKQDADITHKITELKEKNLGNLKERVLNVEVAAPASKDLEKECIKIITKEKSKKEEKKVASDESAKKRKYLFTKISFSAK